MSENPSSTHAKVDIVRLNVIIRVQTLILTVELLVFQPLDYLTKEKYGLFFSKILVKQTQKSILLG